MSERNFKVIDKWQFANEVPYAKVQFENNRYIFPLYDENNCGFGSGQVTSNYLGDYDDETIEELFFDPRTTYGINYPRIPLNECSGIIQYIVEEQLKNTESQMLFLTTSEVNEMVNKTTKPRNKVFEEYNADLCRTLKDGSYFNGTLECTLYTEAWDDNYPFEEAIVAYTDFPANFIYPSWV